MEGIDPRELKAFFLLQSLTAEELTAFLAYCQRREYFEGHAVFHEKEHGEALYIIIKGSVEIMRQGGEVLATLCDGDFFGEVALFDYALRTAGAIAKQDTVLLEVNRNDFNKLFVKEPSIAAKLLYQMMTEMSRRLRVKNSPSGGIIFS